MYAGNATRASTLLIRLWAAGDADAVRSVIAAFDARHDRFESREAAARRIGVDPGVVLRRSNGFAAAMALACRAAVWSDPSPVFANLDDDTLETPSDAEPRIAAVLASPAFGAAAAVMATADRGPGDPVAAAAVLLRRPGSPLSAPLREVERLTGLDVSTVSRLARRVGDRLGEACRASGVGHDVIRSAIELAGDDAAERCLAIARAISHENEQ